MALWHAISFPTVATRDSRDERNGKPPPLLRPLFASLSLLMQQPVHLLVPSILSLSLIYICASDCTATVWEEGKRVPHVSHK